MSQKRFNHIVGLGPGPGEHDFHSPELNLNRFASIGRSAGHRSGHMPVANEHHPVAGVSASADEGDKLDKVRTGKMGGKDPLDIEQVVGIDDNHGVN